jgi:hypothetical protein
VRITPESEYDSVLLDYCNSGFVKTTAITIVQLSPLQLLLLLLLSVLLLLLSVLLPLLLPPLLLMLLLLLSLLLLLPSLLLLSLLPLMLLLMLLLTLLLLQLSLLLLLLAVSDADVEVLFDTVDVFAGCEGGVRRLVVDQLAAVRRRPVLQQEQSV